MAKNNSLGKKPHRLVMLSHSAFHPVDPVNSVQMATFPVFLLHHAG
jgi:hypothetical protein